MVFFFFQNVGREKSTWFGKSGPLTALVKLWHSNCLCYCKEGTHIWQILVRLLNAFQESSQIRHQSTHSQRLAHLENNTNQQQRTVALFLCSQNFRAFWKFLTSPSIFFSYSEPATITHASARLHDHRRYQQQSYGNQAFWWNKSSEKLSSRKLDRQITTSSLLIHQDSQPLICACFIRFDTSQVFHI